MGTHYTFNMYVHKIRIRVAGIMIIRRCAGQRQLVINCDQSCQIAVEASEQGWELSNGQEWGLGSTWAEDVCWGK